MSTTVTATKKVSFKLPYTGKTFQELTSSVIGRDGYIEGGAASDDGIDIELEPVTFVQRGIVAVSAAVTAGLPVPTAAEPWFVVAAIPDDHPDSGVVFSVTADIGAAAQGLVVAFKTGGRWQNPIGVNVAGAARRSADQGIEVGGGVLPITNFTTNEVATLHALKGQVVDSHGERRDLLTEDTTANAAVARELATLRPHATRYRSDHVLLRQPEGHSPDIVLAMGSTATGQVAVAPTTLATPAAPAKRAGYYALRGGTDSQQWWAWGDAAALKVKVGGGVAATLLTGAGNINEAWIAGQRATDSAVIILYIDGLLLRVVSINATTGAQVNAPVTIANTGGALTHMRAVLDRNELLHVTFENDEATQQIYYGTCSIATASFGTVGIAPTYAIGAASATNDTWPSIGVDRKGNVTIAYIQGTGANEFGDLVVATLDSTGELVSQVECAAATDVAVDARTISDISISDGYGFVPTAFLNVRRTAVVVTPYDEVYVLTVGLESGVNPTYILIYNEEYETRHGSSLVNAMYDIGTLVNSPITALAAVAGEFGEIVFAFKQVIPANDSTYYLATLNPRPFDTGRENALVYLGIDLVREVETSGFTDLLLSRGPRGGFQLNYVLGLDVETADLAGISSGTVALHPRDVPLGGIVVPPANVTPEADDIGFEVFNARPKRMNFPFLVGNHGDYQGYNSLHQACIEATRVNGEVVVRNGHHVIKDGLLQFTGRLRGESRSVILFSGDDAGLYAGTDANAIAYASTGRVFRGASSKIGRLYPGCVVEADAGGGPNSRHHVLRRMGWDDSGAVFRVVLGDAVDALPAAGTADLFWGGISIEDLTFGSIQGNPAITIENGYRPVVRNVTVMGDLGMTMKIIKCLSPLLDGVDFTDLDNGTDRLLQLDDNEFAVCRDVRVTAGQGEIEVLATNTKPMFIHCGSEETTPGADVVFNLAMDAYMLTCAGATSGAGRPVTLLNPTVLIDNTGGDTTEHLVEMVGDESQTGALMTLQGRWKAGLGVQTFIDSIGEVSWNGDHLRDDFDGWDGNRWRIEIRGTGAAGVKGGQPGEINFAAGKFEAVGTSASANLDLATHRWSFSNTDVEIQAHFDLEPGDIITTIEWASVDNPGAVDASYDVTLYRADIANGTIAVVQTDNIVIGGAGGLNVDTITYNVEAQAGEAYFLGVVPAGASLGVLRFSGATVNYRYANQPGIHTPLHTVDLATANTATVSDAVLLSRGPVADWGAKPLVRVRVAFGQGGGETEAFHRIGLSSQDDITIGTPVDTTYFMLDLNNAEGLGASAQLRFVLVDQLGAKTSVLTGFTPTSGVFVWLWIGYKSATEAYWGISTTLDGAFVASGSLATGGQPVQINNCFFWAGAGNRIVGVGGVSISVDEVHVRTSTKVN